MEALGARLLMGLGCVRTFKGSWRHRVVRLEGWVPMIRARRTVREQRALAVVCAVLFLTFLDTTIVSVALAGVQSQLHAGVTQLQWVVNGYALTFASFMMIAG